MRNYNEKATLSEKVFSEYDSKLNINNVMFFGSKSEEIGNIRK